MESAAAASAAAERVRECLPNVRIETVDGPADIPEPFRNGRTIYLHTPRGEQVTRCPGSRGHICCNYLTAELYAGCAIGCSYCIMRSYLNFSPISVVVDAGGIVEEIRSIARTNPDVMIRVGTGEVGDSLLYDPLFELSREIIEGTAREKNVFFEMKTKTGFVDHLLSVPEKGNAIIGFSVGPESVIEREEGSGASLDERLDAADRAVESGYRVSFHFDPIFYSLEWEKSYLPVVKRLSHIPDERVAWISLGTFRYTPALKNRIGTRPYLFDELVPCRDGKYRYIQTVRSRIYKKMKERIASVLDVPVYLCMESPAVWKRVFGGLPDSCTSTRTLFRRPRIQG